MRSEGEKLSIDVSDLVTVLEPCWIPLHDGRRLAARLFIPKRDAEKRYPVIMEYIPYVRVTSMHSLFAYPNKMLCHLAFA
jgi:predicted acyl esterase